MSTADELRRQAAELLQQAEHEEAVAVQYGDALGRDIAPTPATAAPPHPAPLAPSPVPPTRGEQASAFWAERRRAEQSDPELRRLLAETDPAPGEQARALREYRRGEADIEAAERADAENPAVRRPPPRPAGMPDVWPTHALPRRGGVRKAVIGMLRDMITGWKDHVRRAEALDKLRKERSRDDIDVIASTSELWEATEDLYALIEEFLIKVAHDEATMDGWLRRSTNEHLMSALMWYLGWSPVGEAEGSQ